MNRAASAFTTPNYRHVLPVIAIALLIGCQPMTGARHADAMAVAPRTPPVISREWQRDRRDVLDGGCIRLLVWNVQKAGADEWIGDFRTLAADRDLVLLQEARLHAGFTSGLIGLARWDMTEAWRWRRIPNGVLTASDATPVSVRALENREPLLRLDKSALVTEYRIAGHARTLLVANVHAINFTADTRAFRAQLESVARLLQAHEGPVILSGDLNTWRAARHRIVADLAAGLQLREVRFDGPRKQFGRFPLDHVYYRGLDLQSAEVPAVFSSDHNPLLVTFRVQGSEALAALAQAALPVNATGVGP